MQRQIDEQNDGLFYMGIDEYLEHMDFTYINYDTTNWYHAYFMMWDDPGVQNGNTFYCGEECTQHKLIVKSSVAQNVRIGAHTYRFYTYADALGECPVRTNDPQLDDMDFDTVDEVFEANSNPNVIKTVRDEKTKTFTNGAGWLREISFKVDEEVEILVEFNWARKGVTKDWSVTAWGEIGLVSVRHSEGIESEHFSYTKKGEMIMDYVPKVIEEVEENPIEPIDESGTITDQKSTE